MDDPCEPRVLRDANGASRVGTLACGKRTSAAEQAGKQIVALVSELDALNIEDAPLPTLSALLMACASIETRVAVRMVTASGEAPDEPATRLLTVDEVAARTGMSREWFYREARAGRLPFARRLGRRVAFDEVGLQRWLDRRRAR
jgi:excisionase family DNA binding protein